MRLMRYVVVLLVLAVFNLYAESDGYKRWMAQKASLMQDSDVMRYYTFEDVKDSKSVIKDVKGSGADLVFVPYRDGEKTIDDLKVIDGRFNGKKAVRLDLGWYQGKVLDIKDKQFTLSLWFRRQGAGGKTSANGVKEGSIVSVAGWDRGWSAKTVYDTINTLRFCLGQPGGSEKVMSDISVPDNAWHHLAATWDGSNMQIYFNGVLVGKKEYKGAYTPSLSGDFLRIGYDGSLLGSVILDIDELVIYNRALNLRKIRGLGTASQSPANEILESAGRYINSGDYKGARKEYEKLKGMASVEYGREIALFNIAESYRLEKDYANAHKTYGEIFALPGLTANYRIYGMFKEAGTYLEQKDYNNARKVCSEIKKVKGTLEHHLFRAELFIADTYRAERKYKQALSLYRGLLKETDSSSFPHENHRLELVDRIENLEGLADGEEEKSPQVKRAEWVNSPRYGIYVSLQGKDDNSGTKEKPFATIKRAQEEVRKIKAEGMPEGGIAVYLRGGKYFLTESLVFNREDSGTDESPVVYRSYPGEEARLIGGKQITNFKPLDDPDILKRLPAESRGRVWVADLKEAGINNYGHLLNRGAGGNHPSAMELFYNTKVMKLSRWPNEDWLFVADLVTPDGDGGKGDTVFQKGRFRYSGDRPLRWKEEKEIWTTGYFAWPWDRFHVQVTEIDTENRIVNLTPNINFAPSYGSYDSPVRRGKPYYFYNILSEIDIPEEWYVDRSMGRLYFYPPEKLEADDEIIVSTLDAPILKLQDTSNMVFHGLTLECSWYNGVDVSGGRNNLITGGIIRNIGRHAVNIDGGFQHGVVGCDIYDIAAAGVMLKGGNWEKLIPSRHYVENNHIYRFNRFDGGYRPAAMISGIGNRVSHNLISDSSHQAIMFDFNNHVIEFNEIYDVVHEAKDAGVMYIYGEPKYLINRGSVIRYNFIHHVSEHSSAVPYANPGLTSIYLDALNAGITMTGNVFYRNTGGAIFTHGSDSRVEDNVFVDNFMDVYQGNRYYLFKRPERVKMWKDNMLETIRYNEPPWSSRYPQLSSILEKGESENPAWNPAWPRDVFIERNISMGGRFLKMSEGLNEITVRDNMEGYDPLFVNPEGLDFSIRTGSPAYGMVGYESVPFAKIGLYEDTLRASWPAKRLPAGKYYKPEKVASLPPLRINFGTLVFISSPASYDVKKKTVPVKVDGKLDKEEWAGLDKSRAMVIEKHYLGQEHQGNKSYVWMSYDNEALYIGVENEPDPVRHATKEEERESGLGTTLNELCIEGIYNQYAWWWDKSTKIGPVFVFTAYPDGRLNVPNIFGMPGKILEQLTKTVEYKSVVLNSENSHWTAEWKIPFASINISSGVPDSLRFNIAAAKTNGLWFAWVPSGGSIWRLDNGGILKFLK